MSAELLIREFELISDSQLAIARLRKFVYTLAITGKLTDHYASDSSVADLARGFGTAKPANARLDAGVTTLPFPIPEHWILVPLSELGALSGGMTPSKSRSDFWGGEIPWLSPKDIKADELRGSELKITSSGVDATGLQIYPPGCLFIVARSGILKRTLPVAINRVPATANQDMKVLRPFVPEMDRYLQIMFRGMTDFILAELVKTGTTVQSLKYDEFAEQLVPVPPLAEQHRIVAKVDELMVVCDSLEVAQRERESYRDALRIVSLHRVTSTDENADGNADIQHFLKTSQMLITKPDHVGHVRQAILALAVQGRLTVSEPEKWNVTMLGDVGAWGSGGTPNTANGDFYGGSIPWVVIGDLNEGVVTHTAKTITELGLQQSSAKIIEPGTVLIAMYGASVGKMGIAGMRCSTNQAIAHCVPDESLIEPDYLFLLLRSIRASLVASAKGGAQPNISQTVLKGWRIALPPLSEQRSIASKLAELMTVCDELEVALASTQREQGRLSEVLLQGALDELALPNTATVGATYLV